MIIILLSLIMSAKADPDYYAVHIEGDGGRYKIFTKISKCGGAVYQSGDNRVLFQDGVWKIGILKNYLDCKTLSSDVEEEYRAEGTQIPNTWSYWIDIEKTEKYGEDEKTGIWIKGFDNRVEVRGFKLVHGTGTKEDATSKEDCLMKDWGKEYPHKHIVVAFKHSACFYDFVDQAELEYDVWGTMFVHPAGKNVLRMIWKLIIIIQMIENERTTTERSNGNITPKVGKNSKTTDKENDGKNQIYIIVIVALALVVVAGVASFLIKTVKDWKIKQTTETEDYNENYGNLDTEQYYEEDKKSKIVHSNDYYK